MTSTVKLDQVRVGDKLPTREHMATNVGLFLYNAAIWNPHRIHYDEKYTTDVEGHPGIVIDGPLQGDWLSQVALNWIGQNGELLDFEYSNRKAAYLGDKLTSGGEVVAVDNSSGEVSLSLFIRNEDNEVITPGNAIVQFDPGATRAD
jgi:3-methylfumaryl-CoA hydratase